MYILKRYILLVIFYRALTIDYILMSSNEKFYFEEVYFAIAGVQIIYFAIADGMRRYISLKR